MAIRRGEDGLARGPGGIPLSFPSTGSTYSGEGVRARSQTHHTQTQSKQGSDDEDKQGMRHLGKINIAVLDGSECLGSGSC